MVTPDTLVKHYNKVDDCEVLRNPGSNKVSNSRHRLVGAHEHF